MTLRDPFVRFVRAREGHAVLRPRLSTRQRKGEPVGSGFMCRRHAPVIETLTKLPPSPQMYTVRSGNAPMLSGTVGVQLTQVEMRSQLCPVITDFQELSPPVVRSGRRLRVGPQRSWLLRRRVAVCTLTVT